MKTFALFITMLLTTIQFAVAQNPRTPQPFIAAVWCHDKEVTDSLHLDHKSNNLRFYLHNRQNTPLDSIQYQVMMEGVDDFWRAPGEPGWTWYPELKPGKYRFMARARYKGKTEWSQPAIHHFEIQAPWWATPIAITGYLLLTIALTVWILYLIRARIKSHNALVIERENSRYKSNFVVYAASEFRTPLSVIRSTIEKVATNNDRQLSGSDVKLLRHSLAQLLQGIERMSRFDDTAADSLMPEPDFEPDNETRQHTINPDITIMVAEPDFSLANLVKSELQPLFNVILASSGDLYDQIRSLKPNVLVIDTGIHGTDAFSLVKRIKSEESLAEITVIITSDLNTSRSLLKLVQSDADDFLNKPYDSKVLIAMVIKHLRRIQTHPEHHPELPEHQVNTVVIRNQAETQFLETLNRAISDGMSDNTFGVAEIQQALGISRVRLYERIKTIMGMTPLEYLRNARLNRAVELLSNPDMSVKEIRVAVGMPDATSFHRHFRDRFGMTPTEYRAKNIPED